MFFELEDVKRRHSLYFDVYNVGYWVPAADNSMSWNLERGAIIGVTSQLFQHHFINYLENFKLLLKH
jgi:solute carrier family 25 oxoglutarate transporter 11